MTPSVIVLRLYSTSANLEISAFYSGRFSSPQFPYWILFGFCCLSERLVSSHLSCVKSLNHLTHRSWTQYWLAFRMLFFLRTCFLPAQNRMRCPSDSWLLSSWFLLSLSTQAGFRSLLRKIQFRSLARAELELRGCCCPIFWDLCKSFSLKFGS